MKNWFDTWFNTKYYHILYKNRNNNEAELFISNLVSKLNVNKQANILDLACGKGRHAIYLNKLGFNVTGVDLSTESILHAKKFENKNLTFFVHDMRNTLPTRFFSHVFNLFTSIGYFENKNDNIKMLKSIDSYTKKDGVLVIDFMNAQKVINNLVMSEIKTVDNIEFNISRKIVDGFIIKTIKFTDNNQLFEYQEKVQALMLADFEMYLKNTNFTISNIYGDYNLGNFNPKTSNRLIIIAKK